MALEVAEESLSRYAHRFRPKTYTQHQLFACLVLKEFFKTDYRSVTEMLRDCPHAIESLKIGQPTKIAVIRNGKRVEMQIVPGSRE